jgi:hypothetical protein
MEKIMYVIKEIVKKVLYKLGLNLSIDWSILGETYENDDCLKIICGKLSS